MNCGMRFALDKINHVEGGCNPSPLKREFSGDKITIAKSDIIAGGYYF
ncbi:MAG: DUF2318 domain-containing protein [Deferribacteraceae bacterium]|jgi:uncharacterized membrane protein|nr:DUF2318 domain-containing protein [Deferribacteraceae bacterium]